MYLEVRTTMHVWNLIGRVYSILTKLMIIGSMLDMIIKCKIL